MEETRTCKAVGMKQQGAWTRWENAVERKVTWAELWKTEPQQIKFLIQAIYDVLPCPSNLHTWGIAQTPACPLCSKRGTLEHILSCGTRALGDGRYRWRHDQVLKTIAEAISTGLELSATDWQLLVDLEREAIPVEMGPTLPTVKC